MIEKIIELGKKYGIDIERRQARQWLEGKSPLSRLLVSLVADSSTVRDFLTVESHESKKVAVLSHPGPVITKIDQEDAMRRLVDHDMQVGYEWGTLASDTAEPEEFEIRYVGDAPGIKDGWKKVGAQVSVCVDEVAYSVTGVGIIEVAGDRWLMAEGGKLERL